MDKYLRFSDYEVFAYLAAGIAAQSVVDFAFETHWILAAQWTASEAVAVIFSAYIIGQVVAGPASWLFERRMVHRVLGAPSRALFGDGPRGRCAGMMRLLFRDHYMPLDRGLADRVRSKARSDGVSDGSGETLFWAAFAHAKRDASTYARMEQFLKLYGFCRNIAFIGMVGALLIAGDALWRLRAAGFSLDVQHRLLWAATALMAGIALFYRFLKFYRLYAVEVFVGYAGTSDSSSEVRK